MRLHVIILSTLICSLAMAASGSSSPPPMKIPDEFQYVRPAKIQGKDSDSLIIVKSAIHHTTAMIHREGIWPDWSKGLVVLVPGTSGNVNSEYNIENSMGILAKTIVNDYKRSVLVLTPPIYWLAEDDVRRQPIIKMYSELEPHMIWLSKMFSMARRAAPMDMHQVPHKPLYYIGRSTGAAYGAEALDRFLRNPGRQFSTLQFVKRMLLIGLDGHAQWDIEQWHKAEIKFYTEHPEKGDFDVIYAAPKFFKQMRWQSEMLMHDEWTRSASPSLLMMAGARDEFQPLEDQVRPIREFSYFHPEVTMRLLIHDFGHSPTVMPRGYVPNSRWTSKSKDGSPMSRVRLALDQLFAGDPDRKESFRAVPHQFSFEFLPNEALVRELLDEKTFHKCMRYLKGNLEYLK